MKKKWLMKIIMRFNKCDCAKCNATRIALKL